MNGSDFRHSSGSGWLVRERSGRAGIGKVVGADEDHFTVEYFHSVTHQERMVCRREEISRVPLSKQTRCYVFSLEDDRWHMGRIGERDGQEYEVNLPDRASIWLPEQCIYVRCAAPTTDPTDTLIAKGQETARFHESRSRLIRALVRQRAASRGMTGLTSARIELFPHQVEVTRRVLEDALQRYLLADEVGLGKTIEAGILIRQFLIDEAYDHVLVLVPALLVDQWRRELDTRFDAFRSDRVHVVSTAELDRVSTHVKYGMLVIDEAHHIAAWASAREPDLRTAFDVCRELSHETKRVILLSATPAANHEAQFLAMLHLLDPDHYRLDEVGAFRERVRMRQDIGRLLLTITEEAKPFSLKLNLPRLAAMFPKDERLAGLADEVLALLETDRNNTPACARPIRAIRTHISETYRLHRRMLRNRRSAIGDVILHRGDQRLVAMHDEGDAALLLDDALDEWRLLVATAVRRLGEEGQDARRAEEGLKACFLALVESADGSPELLREVIRWRLHGDCEVGRDLESEFPVTVVAHIRSTALVEGEALALQQLLQSAEESATADHRMKVLVDLLQNVRARAGRRAPPRCVVFTSFSATAERIAERLIEALGPAVVAQHRAGMPREIVEEGVHRFQNSYDCFVLVCDRTAEEGRNFQFADHLIHFDLPWHPNRLEQRIGRVDRISRVRDLTAHALLGRSAANSLHEAWFRLLTEGFRLFETSIASLQFYVDETLPALVDDLFRYGPQAVVEWIPRLRTEIDEEREKIEEQAAIDEIDARDQNAVEFYETLEDADADHVKLQEAIEGWLCKTLNFDRELDRRTANTVRYSATKQTLVPGDILATRFRPFLNRSGTYDRTVAARHPEVALHRLGDEFIEALADYVTWDDRGQAFAIWRQDPSWSAREGAEWVGYRFDVIIEADTRPVRALVATLGSDRLTLKSLDRRADALFPPKREAIFVDAGLAEVSDPALLQRLRKPFRDVPQIDGLDHNLTKHRVAAIEGVVPEDQWERLCREARDTALRMLGERPSVRERCEMFAAQASKKLELKLEQLRLRGSRAMIPKEATNPELHFEEALGNAIIRGIRVPRLRVDAVGFIVISGRGPLSSQTIIVPNDGENA